MNAWAKLVQKTYNANKHKAGYKLKNAMRDSKKIYKTMKRRGGDPTEPVVAPQPVVAPEPVVAADPEVAPEPVVAVGGKKKSKKNKSAKKSRKNRN
jgi:hypothetical protein